MRRGSLPGKRGGAAAMTGSCSTRRASRSGRRQWKLVDELPALLAACRQVASDDAFVLLTAHTAGLGGETLVRELREAYESKRRSTGRSWRSTRPPELGSSWAACRTPASARRPGLDVHVERTAADANHERLDRLGCVGRLPMDQPRGVENERPGRRLDALAAARPELDRDRRSLTRLPCSSDARVNMHADECRSRAPHRQSGQFADPGRRRVARAARARGDRADLVDGGREARRAIEAGAEIETAFVCPNLLSSPDAREAVNALARAQGRRELVALSERAFGKLAYGDRSDGIVLVVRPGISTLADLQPPAEPLVVVTEDVEKPGNLGAILRSADGAGADAVIAVGGTDLFNPNVI